MSAEPDTNAAGRGSSRRSGFMGDVLRLATGTVVVQIIGILASPVLTRLFDPDAFGVAALFVSIAGIPSAIICLRYELAIVLSADDQDGANLVVASILIALMFSLASVPLIWLAGPNLVRWLKAPELLPYLWLLPPILLFGGVGMGHPALNYWATRKRRFNDFAISRVTGSLANTIWKLWAGFLGFNTAGGLVAGTVAGAVTSPFILGGRIWRTDGELFRRAIRLSVMWSNLKRYRKFPVYNTLASLLNSVSWQIPPFLLAVYFSTTVVGYYALASQVLAVPMNLVGDSIAQVFHAHASTAHQEGRLPAIVAGTFRRLVAYSLFPLLLFSLIGRELIVFIFGTEWSEAGVYAQILSPWICFWFVSSPMSRLYSVLERNEAALRLNIVILSTRVVAIWIGGTLGSPRLALILFSLSGALVYGLLSWEIMRLAGVSWVSVRSALGGTLLVFTPAGLGLLVMRSYRAPGWSIAVASILLVAVYFACRVRGDYSLTGRRVSSELYVDARTMSGGEGDAQRR